MDANLPASLCHKLLDYRIYGTDLVPDPKHPFP
jgi:hypothetical protein